LKTLVRYSRSENETFSFYSASLSFYEYLPKLLPNIYSTTLSMNGIVSKISDTPAKACGVSLMAITLSYFAIKGLRSDLFKSVSHSYPPGPPRNLLIGAMKSFPKDRFVETFCEWAKTYGKVPL
jgi:hypothetical protein